jgi:predicted nucleic acid-binding Zn ribbon protein
MAKKKKALSGVERRRLRIQQILFISIGVIIILSMVFSLIVSI